MDRLEVDLAVDLADDTDLVSSHTHLAASMAAKYEASNGSSML